MKFLRVYRAFKNVQELVDKRNVEGLLELLHWRWNSLVREEGAQALGKIGDERAIEPLIEALQDKSEGVRIRAAQSLGEIGDKSAVEPLIEALGDKEWMVQAAASWALGKIGDERAVEPLIRAFQDESEDYRRAAAQALGKIGDKRAVEPLIEALQDTVHVKTCAAQALGEIGDERAMEPLIKACKSWHPRLGLEDASAALGKIGGRGGIEALRTWLNDPNEELRLAAADSLLEIGELEPGGNVQGYFIVNPPEGYGLCDDNECPCSGMDPIRRGEGYLYIPRRVVNNRRSARTESAVKHLTNRRIRNTGGLLGVTIAQQGVNYPILCCRQGATRRGLDLQVAAKDAAFWWKTDLVPLRPTPKAK